jgi:LacI family transcriptional regulator
MHGEVRLVGLFAPVRASDLLAMGGHDGAFIGALDRELRRRDRRLVICGVASAGEIPDAVASFDAGVALGFRDDELDGLPPTDRTMVAVDSYTRHPGFQVVRTDDLDGGAQAARLLASRGHRRVVLAGPSSGSSGVAREREAGFRAWTAMNVAVEVDRAVTTGTSIQDGVTLGRRLARDAGPASAVFALADTLAVGIMEGLALGGVEVPRQLSVLGFDDLELAPIVSPRLSTVAQDIVRKARLAADLLAAPPADPRPSDAVTVGVVVVERDTVAAPFRRTDADPVAVRRPAML